MLRPIPRQIAYKGTISGLRISAVDGTAFIDNCAAITAYADNAHRVEIYDSAGKRLVGIAKEAGSGETFGEVLLDTGFDDNSKWQIGEGWTVNDAGNSNAVATAGTPSGLYRPVGFGVTYHYLYKISLTVVSITAGNIYWALGSSGASSQIITETTEFYITNTSISGGNYGLYKNATGAGTLSATSMKQVTAPSTDGIIIVNAKGGSTENWTTKESGFAFNEASYTIIVKKLR